jgi:hypothetical protein
MSVDSASSIQKADSNDSIVAYQQAAADFFDSIGPELPFGFAYGSQMQAKRPPSI